MKRQADSYENFNDLASAQVEDIDYRIVVRPNPSSSIAVIAPHGGGIEEGTSEIARAIAGEDFNLYLLEGTRKKENYRYLHLTSHKFDDPRCLHLLSGCDSVVAIHGFEDEEQRILLGGRDTSLKAAIARSISALGVDVQVTNHRYPANNPKNICNRGRSNAGLQIEMSSAFRSQGPHVEFVSAVRKVLLVEQRKSEQLFR
jgi:phage replication-related protein YjqB (UPF0714/DUF867 family)